MLTLERDRLDALHSASLELLTTTSGRSGIARDPAAARNGSQKASYTRYVLPALALQLSIGLVDGLEQTCKAGGLLDSPNPRERWA